MSYMLQLSTPIDANAPSSPDSIGSITLGFHPHVNDRVIHDIESGIEKIFHPGAVPMRIRTTKNGDRIWVHLIIAFVPDLQPSLFDEATMSDAVIEAAFQSSRSGPAYQKLIKAALDNDILIYLGETQHQYTTTQPNENLKPSDPPNQLTENLLQPEPQNPTGQSNFIDGKIENLKDPTEAGKKVASKANPNSVTTPSKNPKQKKTLPPIIEAHQLDTITNRGAIVILFRDGAKKIKMTIEPFEIIQTTITMLAQLINKETVSTDGKIFIKETEINKKLQERIFEWLLEHRHNPSEDQV